MPFDDYPGVRQLADEICAQYSDSVRVDVLFILKAYELANKYDVSTYSSASAEAFKHICGSLAFGLVNLRGNMDLYRQLYYGISHDPHELREAFIRAAMRLSSMPSEQLKEFTKKCPEFAGKVPLSVMPPSSNTELPF